MDQDKVDDWIDEMIRLGKIIPNRDGTFCLDNELQAKLQTILKENPELFARFFPDRVH